MKMRKTTISAFRRRETGPSATFWRKQRRVAGVVGLLLVAACSTDTARPSQTPEANPAQPATAISIPLWPYFRGLRTVKMSIGGAEYSFLFDTGGGRTLVAPELAAKLGCKPRGRDVGYRMNGEPVIFQSCDRLRASVSSFTVQVAPVAVFNVNSLLPSELPRIDGVISLDSFRGQVVTLDWARNRLILHSAADAGSALGRHGIPVRFATGENGAALSVLVPVHGEGDQMWFLLDSGDIKGTLIARHLVEDGSIHLDSSSAAQLRVGSRRGESLSLVVDDINYDGVLGAHFLQTHVISLDLRRAPYRLAAFYPDERRRRGDPG